ncbi:MarR family winged helix-turn-helix transcriptional regulator [Aureimonas sp. AU40]|uniref:MarR family winged helix-turn-helix transcriptional regulator n=1 Tax=Aureimonas sp. AU40 TaxID=1637747 RepID=UPI0007857F81|nr:MarR family transcriptional regulator [Aureimonas sp. AU40]
MTEADPALKAAFAETLMKTARKLRTRFNARVVARGLTYPRARALAALSRQTMTQRELAEDLELEGPTVVRLLDGMEALGLLRRLSVEGDRRVKRVELTEHGQKTAAIVAGIAQELCDAVLAGVPATEAEDTLRVLALVSEAIDRDRAHAG